MSAIGIKVATTTPNALAASTLGENDVSSKTIITHNQTELTVTASGGEKNSSVSELPSLIEQVSLPHNGLHQNEISLENSTIVRYLTKNEEETPKIASAIKDFRQGDVESTSTQLSPGLSLLQQTAAATSPPPHSYRHSRAYRHFKNPPQPHMCIRTTTDAGEELFINVLSWTRIVIPQEPSDPIPLYGGMRVPPGSPRSPPIVFAVMANPEVLKDSGRHSKDPEERRAMVELMCDFVEAMNPGVKLVRNAVILKDRDISGELKDVWNAVQAQRDREREEQMLLQRQQHQQHFHSFSNASTNGSSISNSLASATNSANIITNAEQMFSKALHGTDDAMLTAVDGGGNSPRSRKMIREVQNDNNSGNIMDAEKEEKTKTNNSKVSPLLLLTEHVDNKLSVVGGEQNVTKQQNSQTTLTNDTPSEDFLESEKSGKISANNQLNGISCSIILKKTQPALTNGSATNPNDNEVSIMKKTIAATSTTPNIATSNPAHNSPLSVTPSLTVQQVPTKKEKLGGFLPNGCIFPRFTKNNKQKDKDKESKTKDKEKSVLLCALKKSKDKKSNTSAAATAATAPSTNSDEKITSSTSKTTATNCNQSYNKQQKNCLQQLECGVQKMDLNNHRNHTHIAENNSAATVANNASATNNTATTTNNSGCVGVH